MKTAPDIGFQYHDYGSGQTKFCKEKTGEGWKSISSFARPFLRDAAFHSLAFLRKSVLFRTHINIRSLFIVYQNKPIISILFNDKLERKSGYGKVHLFVRPPFG